MLKTLRNRNLLILWISSFGLLLIAVEVSFFPENWLSMGLSWGAIGSFLYCIHFIPEALASTKWPNVEGEIVTSQVGIKKGGGRGSASYPIILYSYIIRGLSYQAARIKVGAQELSSTSDNWSFGTLEKYPVGKKVVIFFNPKAPAKSVLEPGINSRIYLFGVIALVLAVIAWIIGYFVDLALLESPFRKLISWSWRQGLLTKLPLLFP